MKFIVLLMIEWFTPQGFHQGPGSEENWPENWFCQPGFTNWGNVFLMIKFRSRKVNTNLTSVSLGWKCQATNTFFNESYLNLTEILRGMGEDFAKKMQIQGLWLPILASSCWNLWMFGSIFVVWKILVLYSRDVDLMLLHYKIPTGKTFPWLWIEF